MGRRGPLPARRDAQGNTAESSVTVLTRRSPGAPMERPPSPPGGLTRAARRVWREFWGSAAAAWVDRGAHMYRLVRWIHDVDRYERIVLDLRPMDQLFAEDGKAIPSRIPGVIDPQRPWLGYGSTGHIAAHPHEALLDKLDARIHRAEVEFGMTPYAGVRLGLAGVQGALTAAQLADLIRKRGDPDDGGSTPDEPWAEGFSPG